jgi:very-short-patch-repair endonuclease
VQRGAERGDKTTARVRGTLPEVGLAARRLRRMLTPTEQVLWDAIRRRRLGGLRFRSQHPVGAFVLDFYCPSCKLVVEVDGAVHDQQVEYDEARTERLNDYGYRVIRFRNEEVFQDLPSVLDRILAAASEAQPAKHSIPPNNHRA